MDSSIQFDSQVGGWTVKIQNIATGWMLAAEFMSLQAVISQMLPKDLFSFGRVASLLEDDLVQLR